MPIGTRKPKMPSHQRVWKTSRVLITLMLAVVFIFSCVPTVGAVTKQQINDLKQQQKDITSSKASLQEKITAIQNDKNQTVKKKTLLEEQIEVIRNNLNVTNNLIAQYNQEITDKTAELEKAKEDEAKYYDLFCERVRAMEENGDVSYWSVVFHSSDFSDLLDRLDMISEIMDNDNHVMDKLAEARTAVASAKEQLESARSEQQDAKKELEANHADLKQQEAALDALVAQMKAKESDYVDQMDALSEDYADLSGDIAAAERQYSAQIEAARKAAELKRQQQQQQQHQNPQGNPQGGGTSVVGKGGYIWPVPGYSTITSPYGWRTHPISGKQSFHGGIDIAADGGARIVASKSGTVVVSGFNSSYGNYVAIADDDGTKTLYAHMRARACSPGDSVDQGQTIGYVGSTGSSTGNHCHFEVWNGSSSGTRTNPKIYF